MKDSLGYYILGWRVAGIMIAGYKMKAKYTIKQCKVVLSTVTIVNR